MRKDVLRNCNLFCLEHKLPYKLFHVNKKTSNKGTVRGITLIKGTNGVFVATAHHSYKRLMHHGKNQSSIAKKLLSVKNVPKKTKLSIKDYAKTMHKISDAAFGKLVRTQKITASEMKTLMKIQGVKIAKEKKDDKKEENR